MSEYFLKFKDTPIGMFRERGEIIEYRPCKEANTLPEMIGYPIGLFVVNKKVKPWRPDKTKVADRKSIDAWLSERVSSDKRPEARKLLSDLGLGEYDVWEIVKSTKGLTYHDHFWITRNVNESYTSAKELVLGR